MPGSITSFISYVGRNGDFSKASRFECHIYPGVLGPASGASGAAGLSNLRLVCEAAELPGYNINTLEGRVYGASYASPANPVFGPLNLTFICTGNMLEYKFFDEWMNVVMPRTSFNANYMRDYAGIIDVRQYKETGQTAVRVRFYNAFPTSMAPITMNWGDDGINKLTVTFRYSNWFRIGAPATTSV